MEDRQKSKLIASLQSFLCVLAAFFVFLILTTVLLKDRGAGVTSFQTDTEAYSESPFAAYAADAMLTGEAIAADYYHQTVSMQTAYPGETILAGVAGLDRGRYLRNTFAESARQAAEVGYDAVQVVAENQLPWNEYYTLLQIVEAEATGGDVKSKILIADVVLNRVRDPRFPDTITEVVWENTAGSPQFSPTADGRMGNCTITESTTQAVRRALDGEDLSEGALFFVARSSADKENLKWFEDSLVYLYEYGGHAFYTFPEDAGEEADASESAAGEETEAES